MSSTSDLPFLIRLLDDRDPAVRPVIREQFSEFGGDISHDLAALGIQVPNGGKKRLVRLLEPGRRETLRDEWLVPSGGFSALEDDWEGFESSLRQLSDFLHDGITLRPSLTDSLDMLADEIRAELVAPTADELRIWLFANGRFSGVKSKTAAETHFDLCRVMESHQGNPISLGLLFMLVGHRLGAEVDGCNYPGHFLTRIEEDGVLYLVDCFHRGRRFEAETLLEKYPELSLKAREAVSSPGHLGLILLRYLTEIHKTLSGSGRHEDAGLFKALIETLKA
ncbi:hypothetical protein JIN77_03295 [Verrucomicrobiaceae bacterium R5-34]|uniref:Protein SirB1 N-terminal domain-containing protein n=1 Tax=Oceaniferula flava TaxID=2800421 RepID=A0AAE2SBF0_9BACT|nr:transglutaminase family protein [Oceaniferula flavus]MBK1829736.1 hypothetical protein [Verrucomicrobiaceae bacterium R5-34]MBK1853922.1 hypothetical protein [Oceaniferula flavus]MBM1135228.1 hypothetical protein [Oceaniferula flavus]